MPTSSGRIEGPEHIYGLFSYLFYAALVALFVYLNAYYPMDWPSIQRAFAMRTSNRNGTKHECVRRHSVGEHR